MMACIKGHLETLRALRERNANPLMKLNWGWNALHVAASSNQLPVCEYLTRELKMNPFEMSIVCAVVLIVALCAFIFSLLLLLSFFL